MCQKSKSRNKYATLPGTAKVYHTKDNIAITASDGRFILSGL